MATYKVIQDIEAEDHILGPLTLRQFIFALIAIFLFYICFVLLTNHVAFLLVVFLPPALFFGFFALPFGRDQPTEVWALAKLRFWFLPRQRIWNQSGVKELVTITVPKKVERMLTNGLSEREVNSRLQALASTIDSRGWAVKHVDVNAYSVQQPVFSANSDRLIDMDSLPQEVSNSEITAADDIMDADNNPIARQFDSLITQSAQTHRKILVDQMNDQALPVAAAGIAPLTPQPAQAHAVAPPVDYWFMNQGSTWALPAPVTTPAVSTVDREAESELAQRLKVRSGTKNVPYSRMRTIQPLGSQPANPDPVVAISPPPDPVADEPQAVTAPPDAAILSLARNNDLNVATLARESHKNEGNGDQPNEVVISLH